MKKGLFLLAAFLIVALPAIAPAQGLLGYGVPGFPVGGAGMYDGSTRPFLTPPTFYVGWMTTSKWVTFGLDTIPGTGVFGNDHRWRTQGVWLGLEEKINLSERCGLMLDGWLLIPVKRRGPVSETEARTILVPVNDDDSEDRIFIRVTTDTGFSRSFETDPDWWYVDAMGYCGCSRTFTVVGGFRYDHFSTRFKNPRDATLVTGTPQDLGDVTVNSYLPYFGIQYLVGGSTGSINVRLIGFPYVPANVTHSETGESGATTRVQVKGNFSRSYFWEIFAQADKKIFGDANIGAFLRWNWLHGQAQLNTDILGTSIGGLDASAFFDRNTITVGGSFSLNFASPF